MGRGRADARKKKKKISDHPRIKPPGEIGGMEKGGGLNYFPAENFTFNFGRALIILGEGSFCLEAEFVYEGREGGALFYSGNDIANE